MFLMGGWMAVDHYRKGLAHFQNENQAHWSISNSGGADFYFDYARQEVVLNVHDVASSFDLRRPFAGFVCASHLSERKGHEIDQRRSIAALK
jgi:hypothetical protein